MAGLFVRLLGESKRGTVRAQEHNTMTSARDLTFNSAITVRTPILTLLTFVQPKAFFFFRLWQNGENPLALSVFNLRLYSKPFQPVLVIASSLLFYPWCYLKILFSLELLKCRELPDPVDGYKLTDGYNVVGSIVRFACNPGCMLYGSSARVCGKDGKWSGTQPYCK